MSELFHPDPQWLRDRWERRVRDRIFDGARSSPSPVVVLVGGQPGAGKTAAAARSAQLHPTERLTVLEGDDYRQFHPDYKRLVRLDPLRMPAVTQEVSGPMVAAAVNHAQREKISVTIEGTFRDSELVTATAGEFHQAGFYVHAVVVAVQPVQSLISTVDRYVSAIENDRDGRWTPVAAHDAALSGMPRTVRALGESQDVDQVTVMRRDGSVVLDLHRPASVERGRNAAHAVLEEHRRPLASVERGIWLQLYDQLDRTFRDMAVLREIRHDDQVERSWRQLERARSYILATTGNSSSTHRPGPVLEQAPHIGNQLRRESDRERRGPQGL
ncbi:zeta toxin family protein [Rudaeicoccus suwonensis]|uniref:UDP-N-acetylglucosamine kinase n=1 Tax=Rudaeicoccus suwonensis TaxID=657409 RepID=A0A561E793_9MICO|nr:zeta toxin family protein [Rudaeicoccus suwonensis]TWE11472.1 zeta toxin [Rudaeicoccus suwonensis]